MTSSDRLVMQFVPRSPDDAADFRHHLTAEDGVEDVLLQTRTDSGFAAETVLAIVILGSAGLAALTRIADWVRDRDDCLLLIDTRGGQLRVDERCDIVGRRGQVIIVTGSDEQVVIQKNEAILDLQSLVTHAIDKSAAAVADLARTAGASAEVQHPRSDL
jgi:hypothetical protein